MYTCNGHARLLHGVALSLQDSGQVFEDKNTGIVFGAPGGAAPERDKNVRTYASGHRGISRVRC